MFLFAYWMVRNEKKLAITKPGGEVSGLVLLLIHVDEWMTHFKL
jgi:hypothetical protein